MRTQIFILLLLFFAIPFNGGIHGEVPNDSDFLSTPIQFETSPKNFFTSLSIFGLVAGLLFLLFNNKRWLGNFHKPEAILINISKKTDKKTDIAIKNSINTQEKEVSTEPIRIMTYATERSILEKLNKFENSTIFTKNNISLPFLASYFGTNTKYLSYVINTHKKKDFNNYINELRVLYIIDKINNEPQYQKYKIAVLSQEAGFSSQSKFAASFKKVTSVSPSLFLLNQQNKLEKAS